LEVSAPKTRSPQTTSDESQTALTSFFEPAEIIGLNIFMMAYRPHGLSHGSLRLTANFYPQEIHWSQTPQTPSLRK
jgi:hypothetical protein